jgi:hypothetical protein
MLKVVVLLEDIVLGGRRSDCIVVALLGSGGYVELVRRVYSGLCGTHDLCDIMPFKEGCSMACVNKGPKRDRPESCEPSGLVSLAGLML